MKTKVIIDTDPGCDDAMALALALASPELEVLGLTIVHGNHFDTAQLAHNARFLLERFGRGDIDVFVGADKALGARKAPLGATFVHGDNALGNVPTDGVRRAARSDKTAVEFIVEQCRAAPGQVTLVGLGPLTNFAAALAAAPALPEWAARCVLMGGVFNQRGNVSANAEANVYNDAMAARMVFSAPWQVVCCPLNVTHQTRIDRAFMDRLADAAPTVGALLRDICIFYLQFYKDKVKVDTMAVHDSTAILALIKPELFTESLKTHVDVEVDSSLTRGVCVADMRPWSLELEDETRNVLVHLNVDNEAFCKLYFDRIVDLDGKVD